MTAVADTATGTLDRSGIAALLADRVPGRPLASPFYTSREIFDLDLAAVFGRSWIFAATEAEIPEPGDYVTVEIGAWSVIIVRDDDEQVRAWHNVCRHRGARILDEPAGSVGTIVCGYHKWTYGVDGALLHAGQQPRTFDRSCFGLKPVHVRSVAGLIHLCLGDEAPADFDDVAARLEPYLLPHRLREAKVAAQVDLVEQGNWKLVMENNRECYHCDGHPELSCSLFPTYGYDEADVPPLLRPAFDRYVRAEADLRTTCEQLGLPYARIEELEGRASGFRVQREPLDGAGESFSPDGRVVSRLPARRPAVTSPGAAVDAPPAQRVDPRAERPRRHLQRVPARAGPDAGAHDLARPPRRGGGRGLRPGGTDDRLAADQRAGRVLRRPRPARRDQPGVRAGPVHVERVPGRGVLRLVRRPSERAGARMTELLTRPEAEDNAVIDEDLVCRQVIRVTHDVTSFVLASPEGRRFAFRPGQYVTVAAVVEGQRVERCYTISSPPTRDDLLEITVKRVPGGPMSGWLHDRFGPGDRLHVTGPLGLFSTDEHPAAKHLFLSAGSGVTPLMSMTRALHERTEDPLDVVFVHSARTPRDIVFRAELAKTAASGRGLQVAAVCETDSADERWAGPRGRLDAAMLQSLAPDLHEREVFTCGPAPYMHAVRDILTSLGVDPARCHEESFELGVTTGSAVPERSASVVAGTCTVEFRRSGRTVECDAGSSILEAGLRAGVPLASSCGEGVCGTCKSTLLSGRVDMQHGGGIRPREIAQGKILLCCSTPSENLVIDA